MVNYSDVRNGLRPGEIANGFAPQVNLRLGNEDLLADTAIVLALLVQQQRDMLAELEQVAELARQKGASIVNYFFLVCIGRGKSNPKGTFAV